jgi:hypothetical protein
MRLTPPQIEQTATQLEAKPVPENSKMAPDLERWFGDHTFFLSETGLLFLEPADAAEDGGESGRVVKVAVWTDQQRTALAPHDPEPPEIVIEFDQAA